MLERMVLLLLFLVACAAPHQELGVQGLSAELTGGIGGLIGPSAGSEHDPAYQARLRAAWDRFDATTPAYGALLHLPPRDWATEAADLLLIAAQVRSLEAEINGVLDQGAAAPAIAALTRLGEVYEAENAWLSAEPYVAPRYKTAHYRLLYRALHPLGVSMPSPWSPPHPNADWALVLCDGCGEEPIALEKAKAAYGLAVEKGWEANLYGDPALRRALARLRVLDPERWPPLDEELPVRYRHTAPGFAVEP